MLDLGVGLSEHTACEQDGYEHKYNNTDALNVNIDATRSLRKPSDAEKDKADSAAIGGMKNPRLSLQKVPGQRTVGRRVARVPDRLLRDFPHVQAAILESIGANKMLIPLRRRISPLAGD